jgi:hypothetical protein
MPTYNPIVEYRGKAFEPVLTEILFQNRTLANSLVSFADNIKANTIFTENINTVTMQTYSSGAPSANGTIALADTLITPVKVMYYDEFDYNTLRPSRFNASMQAGAWNIVSGEFDRTVLANISPDISSDAEFKFWNGATTATKTAVAGLTPSSGITTAEQAYVAAAPTNLFDGVVTRLIYNNNSYGQMISVTGSAITSANIDVAYQATFIAVPSNVRFSAVAPKMYAPYSHKALIDTFNINQTYRDKFVVVNGVYTYLGIEIAFVPLPENTIIAALPTDIHWCTDSVSDVNEFRVDKIANNREDYFYKAIFTIFAHVTRQTQIVLFKA